MTSLKFKLQTIDPTEILLLHDVLEQLKTKFPTQHFQDAESAVCRLKKWHILLSKQDQLGNICFCWFPSAMLVPIQEGTSMKWYFFVLYMKNNK